MDLQARKIHFVQEFLRLNNESLITKFEQILQSEKKKLYSESFSPIPLADLNQIVDKAEEDAANRRIKEIHELDKDIDSWT